MKRIILLCMILTGCSQPTATETALNSARIQLDAVIESLPVECKTDSINMQFGAITSTIDTIENTCATEIKSIKAEKTNWMLASIIMFIVIGVYLAKRILK